MTGPVAPATLLPPLTQVNYGNIPAWGMTFGLNETLKGWAQAEMPEPVSDEPPNRRTLLAASGVPYINDPDQFVLESDGCLSNP